MTLRQSALLAALPAALVLLTAASAAGLMLQPATTSSPIAAEAIRSDVSALSADAMLGRGPGEDGETRAVAYIAAQMAKAGLEPAGNRR